MRLVTRADFVREALKLREQGWTHQRIANKFGVAYGTAAGWVHDPDLSKQKARRKRYQGVCRDCGGPTDGSNGRKNAPAVCAACTRRLKRAAHGTRSRYEGGCRCDACRAANTEAARQRRKQMKGKPPRHGVSGYMNYLCRCDVCRAAWADYEWRNPEPRRRWREKVRGTEPPRHGFSGYVHYGCRCDVCRAANSEYKRQWYARKKEAV